MPRVKRGVIANKKRRNMRKDTKGYRHGRNSKITRMSEALAHAFTYMFAHRRKKKGDFRTLWNTQINAASRENGLSYSVLISKLKKAGIALNRKMLSQIAQENPKAFTKIIEAAK
jgi:large subunit ribosomal protein L20